MDEILNNLVSISASCPKCGEMNADKLVWSDTDDDSCTCASCGTTYEPFNGESLQDACERLNS